MPNQKNYTDIKVYYTSFKEVNDFKYLGSIKTRDGTCRKDIKVRTKCDSFSISRNTRAACSPKKEIAWVSCMASHALWMQNLGHKRQQTNRSSWNVVLPPHRLLRISWKDKKTNKRILKELGTRRRLLSLVSRKKLKYFGHAIRDKKTDQMKIALQGKIRQT